MGVIVPVKASKACEAGERPSVQLLGDMDRVQRGQQCVEGRRVSQPDPACNVRKGLDTDRV